MPKAFQADAFGSRHNQMVMQRYFHHRKRGDDIAGDIDIGARRPHFRTRMVMNNNHRLGEMPQSQINHLTRIDRGLIDRAARYCFIGNQAVLAVKTQDHNQLDRFMGQLADAIILHLKPMCQDRLAFDPGMVDVKADRFSNFDRADSRVPRTIDRL